MLVQIGSRLKYALACLRSCFIFTSFGTFCAQYVEHTSSFKLTQPSNIEVGTCTSLSECKNGVGAIITTSNKNPNFPGEIFRNFSSALQSIESVESCN